jgi:predicted PurR-regulated permease PerM
MNFDIKHILLKLESRGVGKILDFLLRTTILIILIVILSTRSCNSEVSYLDQEIIRKKEKVEEQLDALLKSTKDIEKIQVKLDSLQSNIYSELNEFENLLTRNIYETDSTLIIIRNTDIDSLLSDIPEYRGGDGGL